MTKPAILYFNVMDPENYYQFYDILKIKKQTIVFLDGDIGAGKTTFMDVVTGRTKPTQGRVIFKENINLFKYDESSIGGIISASSLI